MDYPAPYMLSSGSSLSAFNFDSAFSFASLIATALRSLDPTSAIRSIPFRGSDWRHLLSYCSPIPLLADIYSLVCCSLLSDGPGRANVYEANDQTDCHTSALSFDRALRPWLHASIGSSSLVLQGFP